MDKKTKILIGVGILGVGGYLYWKSTQKKGFSQPRTTLNSLFECPVGYYQNNGTGPCLKKYCVGPGMSDLCRCADRSCDKCTCPGGPGDFGGVHLVRNTI